MIEMQTRLQVADNTGAREVMCVKVLGGSKRRYASVGDVIVVSIKSTIPNSQKIKKGDVHRAVIVRTKQPVRRADGSVMRADHNAAVLLSKQNEPMGTRIFGTIFREVRAAGFMKIVSLAPEVV